MESRFKMRSIWFSPTIFFNIQRKCIRVALIVLFGMLCVAHPVLVAAAEPSDPVLQWIGIMNDTVIKAGTSPLITSRVVALVVGDHVKTYFCEPADIAECPAVVTEEIPTHP